MTHANPVSDLSELRTILVAGVIAAIAGFVTVVSAQVEQAPFSQPPLWSTQPDVPAFEHTENTHLAAAQSAIDQILAVKGPRIIANTLVPYDEAVHQLNSARYLARLMESVHPETAFRDSASAMTTKVGAVANALSLNHDVYRALTALDVSSADPATRYYVQRQLLKYRLAGVDKNDATRARIRQLQDRLVELQSNFDRNISDARLTASVENPADLAGLPQDYLAAHKPGPDGKITISTDYPDYFPVMTFAKSEELRRRLFLTSKTRAFPKNRNVLLDMIRTRYEIASLSGYTSWADYNAADKMIGTAKNVADFIQQVDSAARPVAQREFAMLLAEEHKFHPDAKGIPDYESAFLEEMVKRSSFNFDSTSVRPYFPYPRVKQGILDTATKLFNLSFRQEAGVPAWDPTVETWDVFDQGKMIGRFYLDMHPRTGKFSHGAMVPVLDGIRGKQLPEAALVCNLPAPTSSNPGLMEYEDVVTFFHEFGHLMHWILGGQLQWAGISGIKMEFDFAEVPSTMLEEWMRSPQVLATFALHYQTNEPIPSDLVARMNRADSFGRAAEVLRQNVYTAVSFDLYNRKPDVDPDVISAEDYRRYSPFTPTPGIHVYASFGHLGGYSSAYYTYLWDKVIAEDFVTQFDLSNLLAASPAARYRRVVLEPGGSMPASDLVKNFLGRPQNMNAFQRWMGEEFESVRRSTEPSRQ